MTFAGIKFLAKRRERLQYQYWWDEEVTNRYAQLGLTATLSRRVKLVLPRAIPRYHLPALSGLGGFEQYNQRFNHTKALLTCSYGQAKEVDHRTYCRKTLLRRQPEPNPSRLQSP